jgi:hypothetical protein
MPYRSPTGEYRRPSSSARRLLEHHRIRGRAYPEQRYWDRLYLMLGEEAEKRGKTPPPPPPMSGIEEDPTEQDKMDCLEDQLIWADRNNLLHRIQMFFDAMPSSAWTYFDK